MNRQRELGQYMTPYKLALEMAYKFNSSYENLIVLDPSCGDGNLLLAMAEVMENLGVKDIPKRLIGVDIDPAMIEKARFKLRERFGEDAEQVMLIEGDFLNFKNDLFNPILNIGINAVISNPPYGLLREYKFFEACNEILGKDIEMVFLMPLAFIDRVSGVDMTIIKGKPFGVTTGHAIAHHVSGKEYKISSTRGLQNNESDFEVLSGIKLYEVGNGDPKQTKDIVRNKPYSSSSPQQGWLPCLRTGDIKPYCIGQFRFFVDYGLHLAHPKTIDRFTGPKIFVRRMPLWKERTLGAAFSSETILCAGDLLVIRHKEDDIELLQGLEVFLNSNEAAELIFESRPTVLHRDSYPKISAKDLNYLFNQAMPSNEELRAKARERKISNQLEDYSADTKPNTNNVTQQDSYSSLLLDTFPIKNVSEASTREKSIHSGHISTLQMWWARRPLAVSRATIFSALCPTLKQISSSKKLNKMVNEMVPGTDSLQQKLDTIVTKLAQWETINDELFLEQVRNFLSVSHTNKPLVIDTFSGGGSLPVEALRLDLDTYAGELNPVAATALKVAIELLPKVEDTWLKTFENVLSSLEVKIDGATKGLYQTSANQTVIAYHWCKSYVCENCELIVPLLPNKWLAKGKKPVAIKIFSSDEKKGFDFEIYTPSTEKEIEDASIGTISAKKACCPNCSTIVTTKWIQSEAEKGLIVDQMFAMTLLDSHGKKKYVLPSKADLELAKNCQVRDITDRYHTNVPSEEFDVNGIRHTWAYQYGIKKTSDLYNHRQGVALLEVLQELEVEKQNIMKSDLPKEVKELFIVLLALVLNRLVLYRTRHTWWQSNGEFPANMFGKQAIPMVWNYVEMPVNSPITSGWKNTYSWILKVIYQLNKLPRKGIVKLSDAANISLDSNTVDVAIIDPPYFDSIAYSYLSDVFYVWMRSFLKDAYPDWFQTSLTPKEQEAIVDRPHSLATNSKTGEHFKNKMTQSITEIKRVLKRNGALIIMYGHKKLEAWTSLIESVLESGFTFKTSWPVHMERKVKFQHGKLASLSSSLIIVCVPNEDRIKKNITKEQFDLILNEFLKEHINKYTANYLFGNDLATSLIVPACSLLGNYNVKISDQQNLEVKNLLETISERIAKAEMDLIVAELTSSQVSKEMKAIAKEIYSHYPNASFNKLFNKTWIEFESDDPTHILAKTMVLQLRIDDSLANSKFLKDYSLEEIKLLLVMLRFFSLASLDHLEARQLAEAVLSRVSLYLRSNN